ncbi:MAG: Ig-like domain-containing protein, partial [Nanobdellota archaeon]
QTQDIYNLSTIYKFTFNSTSQIGDFSVHWWANNSIGKSREDYDSFTTYELNSPFISLISPTPGENYNTSQKVNLTASATDDTQIKSVEADILLPDESTTSVSLSNVEGDNYFNYLTETSQFGIYNITFIANDTSDNQDFVSSWINVSYVTQSAKFCDFSPCIVGSNLIESRDNIGSVNEPNQPNTIDSCADGTSGSYASDESLENITMRSLNGSTFRGGDTVEVNITAYCYDSSSDNINFIYANDSSSLDWSVAAYENPCPTSGFYTSTRTFVLDNNTGIHAFRGSIQYQGSTTTTCGSGDYDDNDDFEFYVDKPREKNPPSVNINSPLEMTYLINSTILISADITDQTEVKKVYANVTWQGGHQQISLTEQGDTFVAYFNNTSTKGIYNVTFYANDTFNNVNNTEWVGFNINKSPYHVFHGNSSASIKIGSGQEVLFDYGVSSVSNIYFADADSDFLFEDLQAIGRKKDGTVSSQDFVELDSLLEMGEHYSGFRHLWASDNSTPKKTTSFNVYGNVINNVPYINSTNSETFITGALWDTSDSSDDEFDSGEAEDLVFVTKYNENTTGKFGIYGFEARIPGTLDEYTGTTDKIELFNEI